jgi:hypothetical protein
MQEARWLLNLSLNLSLNLFPNLSQNLLKRKQSSLLTAENSLLTGLYCSML